MNSQLQKVKESLTHLALDQNHFSVISFDEICIARELIKGKIYSEQDAFNVLCSMNLLNAAIKRKEYKPLLSYFEIKGHASRILTYISSIAEGRYKISCYINLEEHCAYIEVNGFQFSFHQISINDRLASFAASTKNRPREWEGIRLQRIAGELFRFALASMTSYTHQNWVSRKKQTNNL